MIMAAVVLEVALRDLSRSHFKRLAAFDGVDVQFLHFWYVAFAAGSSNCGHDVLDFDV